MTLRPLHMLLALAVFLVWTFMLVHAVRLETQEATRKEYMLDNVGAPVEIYRSGRVWELGRGERQETKEEHEWANDRRD